MNPHEELMSSAEADKSSAAEADGLDEAVMLLLLLYSLSRYVASLLIHAY